MIKHYDNFSRGIIALNDVVYYVVVIVLFLLLSIRRLDADRLRA
jgi:ABC-2 type transport system permease protein